jgi:hypothetical protein
MKKAIATMMLLAGGLFAAPAFRLGIGIGVPAPVAVVRPACPGPWLKRAFWPTISVPPARRRPQGADPAIRTDAARLESGASQPVTGAWLKSARSRFLGRGLWD